jgi:hypothetical protein
LLVTHDNERAKGKAAAAFDNLGRAIDVNDLLNQAILWLIIVALVP